MAKIIIALLISFLVKVKSSVETSTDVLQTDDSCSCSHVDSEFDSIKNMLQTLNERTCRKVCPSGFDYLPEVDGCFKVIFQSLNWYRAGEVCRKVMPGVHLVDITSPEKQLAIENYLQEEFNKNESSACRQTVWPESGKSAWISGQTRNPTQCGTPYVWRTLEAVEIDFNYTNWFQGEPNCLHYSGEHCAHITAGANYQWNDANCNLLTCALCEI